MKLRTICTVFSLVTQINDLPADSGCPKGSSVHERWCFLPLIHSQQGHDFDAASSLCSSQGLHLPVIKNEMINEAIKDYGFALWLALQCDSGSRTWFWDDGERLSFDEFKEKNDRTCSDSNARVIIENGIWVLASSSLQINNILCVRAAIEESSDDSFPTTWTLAIILCILLVLLSMAIALYKLRERLVGYTEEELSLAHLIGAISFPPLSNSSPCAEITIRTKSGRYACAKPSDRHLWGVELSPNLGNLAHWVLQSSTTQPNKAVIRTFREPHQFLCGRSNGTVLLTDRESPCEHWDVIFLADGTYGLRSWTGNWMSSDEDRVTTRKKKDAFVLEKWNAPSPVTRSRFLRALLPLRQWRTRPSIAAQL